jgi:hypothetical protein
VLEEDWGTGDPFATGAAVVTMPEQYEFQVLIPPYIISNVTHLPDEWQSRNNSQSQPKLNLLAEQRRLT